MGHPPKIMSLQSKSIGIPHLLLKVEEPFKEGYKKAIASLINNLGVKGIVTGDIYVVDEIHGNWMESVCEGLDIEVIVPLWNQNTFQVLDEEISEGFRAVFTCVKQPWFDKEWIGRELNQNSVKNLLHLVKKYGIDPCGENGEYHTMVIDGPIFQETIRIPKFIKQKEGSRFFMKVIDAA
jgi:uncharacterized protein (TIGR00290 family)